jgi:uncharacterized protein (DUF433 family)
MVVKEKVSFDKGQIDGTRITVYDVHYYRKHGRYAAEIAEILGLTLTQVEAAIRHIDDHLQEVEAVHAKIEKRNAAGNSPEIEAKRKLSRAKMDTWLENGRSET